MIDKKQWQKIIKYIFVIGIEFLGACVGLFLHNEYRNLVTGLLGLAVVVLGSYFLFQSKIFSFQIATSTLVAWRRAVFFAFFAGLITLIALVSIMEMGLFTLPSIFK